MEIKTKKFILSFFLLKERVKYEYFASDGEQTSIVRPFIEIATEEKEDFFVYYVGLWRLVLSVSVKPNQYKPSWIKKEELLKNCLKFEKRKRKRYGNDFHKLGR